jgi:hypothetical protein
MHHRLEILVLRSGYLSASLATIIVFVVPNEIIPVLFDLKIDEVE